MFNSDGVSFLKRQTYAVVIPSFRKDRNDLTESELAKFRFIPDKSGLSFGLFRFNNIGS